MDFMCLLCLWICSFRFSLIRIPRIGHSFEHRSGPQSLCPCKKALVIYLDDHVCKFNLHLICMYIYTGIYNIVIYIYNIPTYFFVLFGEGRVKTTGSSFLSRTTHTVNTCE